MAFDWENEPANTEEFATEITRLRERVKELERQRELLVNTTASQLDKITYLRERVRVLHLSLSNMLEDGDATDRAQALAALEGKSDE